MAREEKKLQQKFKKSANSKFLGNPSAAGKSFIVKGIEGSDKFARWVTDAKNNAYSVDFIFIGDSNNTSSNSNESNYGDFLNVGDPNNISGPFGYMNGLAYGLANNNINMYGGPHECLVSSRWTNPATIKNDYGGTITATITQGSNTVTLSGSDTIQGLTAGLSLTKVSGTGVFGSNAAISSFLTNTSFLTTVPHTTGGLITFYVGTGKGAENGVVGNGNCHAANKGRYNADAVLQPSLNCGTSSLPATMIKSQMPLTERPLDTNNFYFGWASSAIGSQLAKQFFNKMHGHFAREIFGTQCVDSFSSGSGNAKNTYPNGVASATNRATNSTLSALFMAADYNIGSELNFTYSVAKGTTLFDNKQHIYRILAWESAESNGYFPMTLVYGRYTNNVTVWNPKTRRQPTSGSNFGRYSPDGLQGESPNGVQYIRSGMRKVRGTLMIDPSNGTANRRAYFIVKDCWNINTNAYDKKFNENVGSTVDTRWDRVYTPNGTFLRITNKNGANINLRADGLATQNIDGFYCQANGNNSSAQPSLITTLNASAAGLTTINAGTAITIDSTSAYLAKHLLASSTPGDYRVQLVPVASNANGYIIPADTWITSVNTSTNEITLSQNIQYQGTFTKGRLQFYSNVMVITDGISDYDSHTFKTTSGTSITTEQTYNNVEAEIVSFEEIRYNVPRRTCKSPIVFTNNLIQNSTDLTSVGWGKSAELTLTQDSTDVPTGQTGYSYRAVKGSGGTSTQLQYSLYTNEYNSAVGPNSTLYYATTTDSTFSIWVKPTSATNDGNLFNIGLRRDTNNRALTKDTDVPYNQGWQLDGTAGAAEVTRTSLVTGLEVTSCKITDESGTVRTFASTASGTTTTGNYTVSNNNSALWRIQFSNDALNKWHRIEIFREGFFTSVRLYPGNLSVDQVTPEIKIFGPQIETNSSAGPYKPTSGTRILSTGSWKPIETVFNLKTESEGGIIKNDFIPDHYGYVTHFWGAGVHKGPYALALQSVYTKSIGFSISSLYSSAGAKIFDNNSTRTGFLDSVSAMTPSGSAGVNTTLRTLLKEYRNRQLSATNGASGRVCIFVQGGVNDAGATTSASTIKNTIKDLIVLMHSEWSTGCGFPEKDFNVVVMMSHQPFDSSHPYTIALNNYKNSVKELLYDADCINKFTFIDLEDFITYNEIINNNYFDYTSNAHCNAGRNISYNSAVGHVHLHTSGYKQAMNRIIQRILSTG